MDNHSKFVSESKQNNIEAKQNKNLYSDLISGIKDAIEYEESGRFDARAIKFSVPEVDVKRIREQLNLTQDGFAEKFALPVGTVKNWEQGTRKPEGTARILLGLIAKMPNEIAREINKLRSA